MGSFRIRDPVRSEEDEINTPQSVQATLTPGSESAAVMPSTTAESSSLPQAFADVINAISLQKQEAVSTQAPAEPGSSSTTTDLNDTTMSSPSGANDAGVRLPPILQVEKQHVTTKATQNASAGRRKNEAHFVCPVPDCGSTFTRRFNLRGHLRSHTEERPYVCDWPGCGKGFARQHDCKRHQSLHSSKTASNTCPGCKKAFSRLDALNRHLRSDGAADCKLHVEAINNARNLNPMQGNAVPGSPGQLPPSSGPQRTHIPLPIPFPPLPPGFHHPIMAIPGEPGQPMQIIQLPMPPPQSMPMQQLMESKPAARQEAVIDPSLQNPNSQPARSRPPAKAKAKKEKEKEAKSAPVVAAPSKPEPASEDLSAKEQESSAAST